MAELNKVRELFQQWGGITATFFSYLHLSHDLSLGLLIALLPFIRADLELNYLQTGILISAFTITRGLSQFLGGWMGSRFSQRIVLAIGLAGIGLSGMAIGFSSTYYFILCVLIIMGVFAGAYHPLANAMLPSYFESARRGKVVALHGVGGNIGFTISPFIGGLLAGTLGWRFAYVILSIPAIIAAIVILKQFGLQKPVNHDDSIKQSTDNDTSVQPTLKQPGIIQALGPVAVIIILAIIVHFVVGTATPYIPIYLVDKHNVTPFYAAMLVGISRSGGIIGSLIGGWLSDRWDRKKALLMVLIAIGPILYFITILPFNISLIVILFCFGLFRQMRQITTLPIIMDSAFSLVWRRSIQLSYKGIRFVTNT